MKYLIDLAKKYGPKYWKPVVLTVGILLTMLALLWTLVKVDSLWDNHQIKKDEKAVNKLTKAAVNANANIKVLEQNANVAAGEVKQAKAAKEVTKRNYDNAKKESAKAAANVNAVRNADYSGVSTVEANRARCAAYPASSECSRK